MPPNGYVRFLNANRERVKQECPELTFADVTKKLGAEWTNMTSEEKKGYMEEAEKAKEIYMKELQEYQQTEAYQKFLDMKSLAKQQQPPTMTAPQMAPSQSQSPMSMPPGAMYSQQQQQQYYEQSGLSPNMHPNQYAAMYQQQQQQQQQMQEQQLQSYAYGMNGEGKSMGMPGGTYGQQQQQLPHQQYYPSSGHSSVASDFGSMSGGSSQYQSRFFQHYGNAPNGMQPYHMNAPAGNGMYSSYCTFENIASTAPCRFDNDQFIDRLYRSILVTSRGKKDCDLFDCAFTNCNLTPSPFLYSVARLPSICSSLSVSTFNLHFNVHLSIKLNFHSHFHFLSLQAPI